MGRGPDQVRALVAHNLVVVRLKGMLTLAERQLARTAERDEVAECRILDLKVVVRSQSSTPGTVFDARGRSI